MHDDNRMVTAGRDLAAGFAAGLRGEPTARDEYRFALAELCGSTTYADAFMAGADLAHQAANGDEPKKPYGDVTYADPGYQDDKKKRYPLDTPDHVQAAWSYINQEANAAKYSADQVKAIKGRIMAAGKKYGIEFSDTGKAATMNVTEAVQALVERGDFTTTEAMAWEPGTTAEQILLDIARTAGVEVDGPPDTAVLIGELMQRMDALEGHMREMMGMQQAAARDLARTAAATIPAAPRLPEPATNGAS